MATLTVQNLTSNPIYISDLYCSIAASSSITTVRYPSDLSRMASLQALIAAGTVAASVVYSANEQASGFIGLGQGASAASGSISAEDIIRVPLTAGTAGSPDDTAVYALGKLPSGKLRILDAYVVVSGAVASSKIQVRSASGGLGTLCAEVATTAAGRASQTATVTASQVIVNGPAAGLFVRRSDASIAGEVFIVVRPEV